MLLLSKATNRRFWLLSLFVAYAMANLFTLTAFPLMHSDESWLSGLSRHIMLTGNLAATEPFFDLKPRIPHALKILFHGLQIICIKLNGYQLYSIRLLSLIFGFLTLFYFYQLGKSVLPSKNWAFLASALLGMNTQFLYASHFGRQEIILLFLGVFSLYWLQKPRKSPGYGVDLLLGTVVGLGIGIHPNSLLIAIMVGTVYAFRILCTRSLRATNLFVYSAAVITWTGFFIALSSKFEPGFITQYFAYGQQQFGVLNPLAAKIQRFFEFYQHLYQRKCGTYYAPHIEADLVIFGIVFFYSVGKPLIKRVIPNPASFWIVLAILSVNFGFILIGRFNYTSIIFLFPLFYLLTTMIISSLGQSRRYWISGLLVLLVLSQTIWNFSSILKYDYSAYLRQIAGSISPDRKVLASLNTEYFFDDGKLLDLRNLSYLRKHHLSFAAYIRSRRIEYIIYPEALDFIHNSRPQWNGVFGHMPYYHELKTFLRSHCQPLHRFSNPAFGTEIAQYAGERDWPVTIYQVLPGSHP
jgi:hypothetical protein